MRYFRYLKTALLREEAGYQNKQTNQSHTENCSIKEGGRPEEAGEGKAAQTHLTRKGLDAS